VDYSCYLPQYQDYCKSVFSTKGYSCVKNSCSYFNSFGIFAFLLCDQDYK
jgi:hypothetical protein